MLNPNKPSDNDQPQLERVSKLIAKTGLASRRAAEDLISAGRVAVNGHFISEQGTKADPDKDKITVDGTALKFEDGPPLVVVLHKPKYTITTRDDPENRPTVFDLLPHKYANLHPVGRLDFETSGVLLFSDDGTLTHLLTHPSHGVEKVYEARVRGEVKKETLEHLEKGIKLEDGMSAPCRARLLAQRDKNALLEITLREGRNRQVRRMLEAISHAASSLRRVSFAGVELEGMLPGEHRELFPVEVKQLRRIAEMGLKSKSRPRSRPKPHPRPVAPDAEEPTVRTEAKPHARMSRSNNGRAQSARQNRDGDQAPNGRGREGRPSEQATNGRAQNNRPNREAGQAPSGRAQSNRPNREGGQTPSGRGREGRPVEQAPSGRAQSNRPNREGNQTPSGRAYDARGNREGEQAPVARRVERKWK